MVFKVSKGGVRSGNTLRGLRSFRTRRYLHQACIVGKSNLASEEIPDFLESTTKDDFLSSTLGSTNVVLSMNKKERWNIPALVSHMIQTGNFNEGETAMSLLERHKLKRKSNCVSFVCNQGRIRHVTPRQKGYFSFKLNNNGSDESNRHRRRRIAKENKKEKTKTTEVFTASGSFNNSFFSSRPEYRLEVYHPCPKSCSLTYNPKYTDVRLELSEEGKMEVRSNVNSFRSKRRHRKRLTMKDMNALAEEMKDNFDQSFSEDYCEASDSEPSNETETDFFSQEGVTENKLTFLEEGTHESHNSNGRFQFSENILASLITQAENARSLCENAIPQNRNKSSRRHTGYKSFPDTINRSHVIYTSGETLKSKSRKEGATEITIPETKYLTLESALVMLTSTETEPDKLRSRFELSYSEAESEPRRFLINVTEDVQNLLCSSRSAQQTSMYMSYLVFIHDGVYDEGLDTFKVIFNSNICTETLRVSESIPFERTSIEEIMNRVMGVLLDLKREKIISTNYVSSLKRAFCPPINFVNNVLGFSMKAFHASDEIGRASLTNAMQEKITYSGCINNVVTNFDVDMFCDICYENINPTQTEAVSGTRLSRCSHSFCDECLRSHFRNKLNTGSVKITCPGYDCVVNIGPVTLLSLLHVSEVSKLFQRACEEKEESNPSSRWCPNPDCGRVIKLENIKETVEVSLDVTCACGQDFCFSCMSQPHWPAKCDQAEEYLGNLDTLKPLRETTEKRSSNDYSVALTESGGVQFKIVEIEGRVCPQCSKFIEKNGGCSFMYCKCTYYFCWICMKEADIHHVTCTPIPSFVAKYTRKVRVRHVVAPQLHTYDRGRRGDSKPEGAREKASLYQKAALQRSEAKKILRAGLIKGTVNRIVRHAQKDPTWKKEVLNICGVYVDDRDLYRQPLAIYVREFLASFLKIKRSLHHVAEFTFVLLQDTPDSMDKRRALRLANDLSGYCCFIESILELGQNQDVKIAIKRLLDIKIWAERGLTTHMHTAGKLKCR